MREGETEGEGEEERGGREGEREREEHLYTLSTPPLHPCQWALPGAKGGRRFKRSLYNVAGSLSQKMGAEEGPQSQRDNKTLFEAPFLLSLLYLSSVYTRIQLPPQARMGHVNFSRTGLLHGLPDSHSRQASSPSGSHSPPAGPAHSPTSATHPLSLARQHPAASLF